MILAIFPADDALLGGDLGGDGPDRLVRERSSAIEFGLLGGDRGGVVDNNSSLFVLLLLLLLGRIESNSAPLDWALFGTTTGVRPARRSRNSCSLSEVL